MEIWYVGLPLCIKVVECAAEFASRRQPSRDAVEDAEVGVIVRVGARNRSAARLLRVPRSELAFRSNLAGWLRIEEPGAISDGPVFTHMVERHAVDLELKRLFPGPDKLE